MLRFHNYFKQSPQNKLSLKNNTQLAYAGQWKKVYSNTEIDKWYVGDYSSANYTITAEFSSNKKEGLQVLVVARPDQATVTVYGRTSIDDSLINISAVVTNSYLSLIANVTDTAFLGTKVIFFANYAECIQPLSLAESLSFVDSSSGGGYDGGGAGGAATSFSQLSGTIGISQIPNGLITPAKLNLNNSLIPTADVIHDLGSATNRWRDLYLSGSSIQLGDATITASGNSVILPSGSTIAGAAINSFSTIQVSGQSNIVADSVSDSLTVVAGPGIEITTDAGSDSITITNTGGGGGGASGVSSGTTGRLAYYASTGSVVQDTSANLTWSGTNLNVTGTITATGAVSYVRAYFDTLVELTAVSPSTWHGMVAHVHETGRIYFAHAGAWAPVANLSDLNIFKTIAVAGQTSVVADSATDTLTLVAGTNVTITTNDTTDAITINAAGGGASILDDLSDVVISAPTTNQVLKYDGTNWVNGTDSTGGVGSVSDSFTTIAVAGQSNIVADSSTDTLTLVAGTGISIATNAGTDTVTITSTVPAGVTNLDGLTDVIITSASNGQVLKYNGSNWINDTDSTSGSTNLDALTDVIITSASNGQVLKYNGSNWINDTVSSGATAFTGLSDVTSASLTVDKIYLPAITRLNVTAPDASAYLFDQYSGPNPIIYAISGTTIAFDLNVGGHPFLIRFSGANYDTGLVHVTTAGVVTTGSSAQGKISGTLYWKIPAGISGTYGYLCSNHAGMNNTITVKAISTI